MEMHVHQRVTICYCQMFIAICCKYRGIMNQGQLPMPPIRTIEMLRFKLDDTDGFTIMITHKLLHCSSHGLILPNIT